MAQMIDGKQIAAQIQNEISQEAAQLAKQGISPCLAVVLVGDSPASRIYVERKKKTCQAVGIRSVSYELPADVPEQELLNLLQTLNHDPAIHGILVQLPLPEQIDEKKVLLAISPQKDVDCFHPINVGNLHIGKQGFLPCTPAGIIEMLKRSGYAIAGKHCVVLGRSNIVGKPVAMLLMREHGTVTICHSRTQHLAELCRQADILVSAVGKAGFVRADMVKPGAIVIDVGMNRDARGKLCGDVDFEGVQGLVEAITPVPGGVGPMTIAMLLKNCILAAKMQNGIEA